MSTANATGVEYSSMGENEPRWPPIPRPVTSGPTKPDSEWGGRGSVRADVDEKSVGSSALDINRCH